MEHLERVVGNAPLVLIDEARRTENIGLTVKLLVDHLPVTVFASGSASFELASRLSEPLTGRTRTFHLHPLSWEEVSRRYRLTDPASAPEGMLRFGMYPRVHTLTGEREKEEFLYRHLNGYGCGCLYRDLLEFEQVKKPRKVMDLLVLLAHQLGREVGMAELAAGLGISPKTVEGYSDILQKMFVLVNVRGFSHNLQKEVAKTSRYFVDVGLRNALVRAFTPPSLRADNRRQPTSFHFWRTYSQKEIDLVEEGEGRLTRCECKWSPTARAAAPRDCAEAHPDAGYVVANRENWRELLESQARREGQRDRREEMWSLLARRRSTGRISDRAPCRERSGIARSQSRKHSEAQCRIAAGGNGSEQDEATQVSRTVTACRAANRARR